MLLDIMFACVVTIATPLLAAGPPCAADPIRVVTAYYELEWEGAREDAEESSRILERANDELATFFGWRPKDRMRVRVFRDEIARVEGAWNDGITMPSQSRHASFSEVTRTAYVARLGTVPATRSALLYAACLQFHALGKAKNLDIGRTWQAWRIALDFARSTWDGTKLRAFASPLVDEVDVPGRALAELGDGQPVLAKFADSGTVEPELAWGVVAMCLHGGDGSYRETFRRYALGDTGTKLGSADFLRTLGPNKRVVADLRTYLEKVQVPSEVIGDWEDHGDAGILGRAKPGERSFCVLRKGNERLSAVATPLPRLAARMGFVAGWGSEDDCATIDIEAPEVIVRISHRGRPSSTFRLPIPGDAQRSRRIGLERVGNQYALTVDDTRFAELELPSGRMGFFVVGAEVAFREVSWR